MFVNQSYHSMFLHRHLTDILTLFLGISQPTHCTQRRPLIVPPSFPSPSTRVSSPSTENPAKIAHQHFQSCGCQKCPCHAAAHSRNMRFTMDLPVHLPYGSNVQCPHMKKIFVHAERSYVLLPANAKMNVANHFIANLQSSIMFLHAVTYKPKNLLGIRTRKSTWVVGQIELPRKVEFVDVTQTSIYCVDPRLDYPVVASPGGDIAEFVYALMAYEKVYGIELLPQEISLMFKNILKRRTQTSPFMVCNDVSHMSKIQQHARVQDM